MYETNKQTKKNKKKLPIVVKKKKKCPNPAAGHCRPTPPPETPGHSQASLGQSLGGSLLLSPGSWCMPGFFFCVCVCLP